MFFKKVFSVLTASALLFTAVGCTPAVQPTPTAEPIETAQPILSAGPQKEAPLFLELTPDTPTEIDLDGDGSMETVVYTLKASEDEYADYTSASITATAQSGEVAAHILEYEFYNINVFALKLDASSDAMTLAYTYEHSSEDYDTVFIKYESSAFSVIPCANTEYSGEYSEVNSVFGAFKDITADNKITVNTVCDVLGTYWGYCEYELKDGMIQKTENGDWFAENPAFVLTLTKELPVTFIENETQTEGTLKAGTKIAITRVSGDYTKAYFITEYETTESETKEGFIEVDVSNYPHTINGIDEAEYFEYIPYAG